MKTATLNSALTCLALVGAQGVAIAQRAPAGESGSSDTLDGTNAREDHPSASASNRDAPAATSRPQDARGWATKPEPRRFLVFPEIGRALGVGASALVWLAVAPFRAGIYVEDRYQVSEHVLDVFFNDARTAGVHPTAAFASGFGLTYGVKAFHSDLFGDDEEVSLSAKLGGSVTQSYQLKFEVPRILGTRVYARGRGRYEIKGNDLFQGIGNDATVTDGTDLDPRTAEIETRFEQRRILGLLSSGVALGTPTRELRLGFSVITNDREFSELDPSEPHTDVREVYDTSAIVGFDGFTLTEVTADVEFDLLDRVKKTSQALRFRSFIGGTPGSADYSFVHYGAEVSLEQTLGYPERILILRIAHEGVAGKRREIPFTELPRLGGAGLLRGYKSSRFRDKLSGIATAEYHYPVHANLGTALFAEAGKVATDYDELGTQTGDWHLGLGGAVFFRTDSGIKFRLDLAYGDSLQVYFTTDVLEAFSRRQKEL